jgi:hypothetical protein
MSHADADSDDGDTAIEDELLDALEQEEAEDEDCSSLEGMSAFTYLCVNARGMSL